MLQIYWLHSWLICVTILRLCHVQLLAFGCTQECSHSLTGSRDPEIGEELKPNYIRKLQNLISCSLWKIPFY